MAEELTQEELDALAVKEAETKAVLAEHAFNSEKVRQLQDNLERMKREGKENMPPLDRQSEANEGKTQYEIDTELLAQYQGEITRIETENPEVFEAEKEPA